MKGLVTQNHPKENGDHTLESTAALSSKKSALRQFLGEAKSASLGSKGSAPSLPDLQKIQANLQAIKGQIPPSLEKAYNDIVSYVGKMLDSKNPTMDGDYLRWYVQALHPELFSPDIYGTVSSKDLDTLLNALGLQAQAPLSKQDSPPASLRQEKKAGRSSLKT